MTIYYMILTFFVYGFLGWCAEVGFAAVKERRFVNRGFLNGPICPIYGVGVTMVIHLLTPVKENIVLLYVASVLLVTVLEGLTGYAMDKIFHNKWWDYSNMPLNIGGYVCLLFSLIWGVACVLIVDVIHPVIFRVLEWLPHVVGMILIVVFGIGMIADLFVTASGIIRMNRRLESMEKIAAELHEISDQLGEEIYKGVVAALEKQEESKQKLEESKQKFEESRQKLDEVAQNLKEWKLEIVETTQDAAEEVGEKFREKTQVATEEMGDRIAALKERYRTLGKSSTFVSRRLMRAFPKMQPRKYEEQMEELRKLVNRKSGKADNHTEQN